ncbi:large ribosomal subunit protein uL18c-like [Lycium ferocissimum]|uniref:large ribosomal subunit protein uL18c-like n=1 Tax=Lycium ferocissimum TaxID=112874 RepID=UPI002815BC88|nr:large ribosomal subunit protein uL18c-like [Lycium ferocissimum]
MGSSRLIALEESRKLPQYMMIALIAVLTAVEAAWMTILKPGWLVAVLAETASTEQSSYEQSALSPDPYQHIEPTEKAISCFKMAVVEGTPERPRLCVFRSNKHIYVQVIDDSKMHTLASASTMQKPISEEFDYSAGPTAEVAKKVEVIAKACLEKGNTKVAFDRGGYPYHGRIEALAEAARENGLHF